MSSTACRHAEGTISSSSVLDVWRMASEDSDQFLSGFSVVHRLCNFSDLNQPLSGEMPILADDFHAPRKLRKVQLLRSSQWMLTKERDDHFLKISPPPYKVLE